MHPETAYLDVTSSLPTYVNSLQYMLLSTGVLGLIMILFTFYKMYSKNTDTAKNMLLVLFILLFSSDVFGGYLAMITFYIAYTENDR